MTVRLTPPAKLKNWQVIIRCIHQRGPDQAACLKELNARGLWLGEDQKRQADLAPDGSPRYLEAPQAEVVPDGPRHDV